MHDDIPGPYEGGGERVNRGVKGVYPPPLTTLPRRTHRPSYLSYFGTTKEGRVKGGGKPGGEVDPALFCSSRGKREGSEVNGKLSC